MGAEVLIDSLDALAQKRKSPEYLGGALADERNFIDLKHVEWMATQDRVIVQGPTGSPLVKGIYQLKRIPGMALLRPGEPLSGASSERPLRNPCR